jgi:hypothetical protein
MPTSIPDFTWQSVTFWNERTFDDFSSEDARQSIENVSGFFDILRGWEANVAQLNKRPGCITTSGIPTAEVSLLDRVA